ncbi:MAG: NADH-quinone oxidoreductase subunit H [Candidatus Nanopelagicales bacterium]
MQAGEPYLAATARPAVLRISPTNAADLGIADGDDVTLTGGDRDADAAGTAHRHADRRGVGAGQLRNQRPGRTRCDQRRYRAGECREDVMNVAGFGSDPFWLICLKVLGVFVLLVLIVLFTIWWERRVVSFMQSRIGPNRAGPFGLLQSLMDGIKLALKEEIIPRKVELGVYILAPILSAVPAFLTWAVIPLGPEVSIFGQTTMLQLTDFPVSVLYVLADRQHRHLRHRAGGLGVRLHLPAAGRPAFHRADDLLRNRDEPVIRRRSSSTRAACRTSEIVGAQQKLWFILLLLPSFMIYTTADGG